MVMMAAKVRTRAGRARKESEMGSLAHIGTHSHGPAADSSEHGRLPAPVAVTTTHKLLTRSWTADVDALETAIGRFEADRALTNDSHVVFFEIPRDEHLHVNVTHKYSTKTVSGWAGPGSVPAGFVHNRTFGDTQRGQMIRHIRNMVFAARS